jgi:hypothetical protein
MEQKHMTTRKKNYFFYIHETTTLQGASLAKYSQHFSNHYQPLMEQQGARLFGHWRANPFNSHWPEITTIWELDSRAHFGSLSEARFKKGEVADSFSEWEELMAQLGAHGEGRLCYSNDDIKSVAEMKSENLNSSAVIQEIMTTKPGRQRDYIEQLRRLFVPWSEGVGNPWLGSFVSATRNEEVIHYWILKDGWQSFANNTMSDELKVMYKTWMNVAPALRDSWDDSFLAALPQHPFQG